jgi:hypothetical protein
LQTRRIPTHALAPPMKNIADRDPAVTAVS